MSDRADQKAPQASQFRLARRRPEFFGQAHERRDLLVHLPCSPRSDLAHAALDSAAAQPLVAHELAFHTSLFQVSCDFFAIQRGEAEGGGRKKGEGATGVNQGAVLPTPRGLHREAPAMPQRGTLRNFWRSCSAGGGSWGL